MMVFAENINIHGNILSNIKNSQANNDKNIKNQRIKDFI